MGRAVWKTEIFLLFIVTKESKSEEKMELFSELCSGKLTNILVILGFSGAASTQKEDINFVVMLMMTRKKFGQGLCYTHNSNVKQINSCHLEFLFTGDSTECKCRKRLFLTHFAKLSFKKETKLQIWQLQNTESFTA